MAKTKSLVFPEGSPPTTTTFQSNLSSVKEIPEAESPSLNVGNFPN